MEALLIFLGVLFVIFCLAYDFFRGKNLAKRYEDKITSYETELNKQYSSKQQLQDEINLLQNKLRHSFEDTVTNLLGWQLFEDRLNYSIKEGARYQLNLGIMFVDIDDFKVINDALSYEIGDALLQEVAERLKSCIRQVDSVSRFTKDTFVILLSQLAKAETAAVVAQRILQALGQPFQIKNHELYITVCIGIATYPADGQDAAALLRNADHALHLAKEKGKHVYRFYQEEMHTKSQRELSLYTGLSRENIFQEFVIYYQPIVNIKNEVIFGMDALLHWQHPELGLINPDELLHYLEKQRKLNMISEWVLQSACRQFLYWRTLGFSPEILSVRISIKQLENTHFIYRISQIVQTLDFKPEWLLLAIKDTAEEISLEALEKAFNMLKYLGIKIALDDFDSSSFSLHYLKSFNINYLRLSSSFINDVQNNPHTISILKSLIYLSNMMGMQIIVPGVDTNEQLQTLKELGCELMEGQLLGVPLTENEVPAKMAVTTQ